MASFGRKLILLLFSIWVMYFVVALFIWVSVGEHFFVNWFSMKNWVFRSFIPHDECLLAIILLTNA